MKEHTYVGHEEFLDIYWSFVNPFTVPPETAVSRQSRDIYGDRTRIQYDA